MTLFCGYFSGYDFPRMANETKKVIFLCISIFYKPALQAASILVAMVSGKNIWRLKFWRKSLISNQQTKRENNFCANNF